MTQFKLGQYLNFDGLLLNLKYINRLHKVKPDIYVNSILDLDLNKLKNENKLKYIVFDKDNTLTFPYRIEIEKNLEEKVEEFKKVFGEVNLAILSNSAGSKDDLDFKEAKRIENASGLKVVKHKFKKPNVYSEILQTFALKFNEYDIKDFNSKEICVVGDRLLVDVLMGKEYGFFTILVNPLTSVKENFIVKIIRKFESFLLSFK